MANPNPSLKSEPDASRLRFGQTKPKAAQGTTPPSPASTRTESSGKPRRASAAMTCWRWPKWPIRPTRASSSFSRKTSRRRQSSTHQRAAGLVPAAIRSFAKKRGRKHHHE